MRVALYDNAISLQQMERASAKKDILSDLLIYIVSRQAASRQGGLSEDEASSLFESRHMVKFKRWELVNLANKNNKIPVENPAAGLAKLVSTIWLSPKKLLSAQLYTTSELESYVYCSLISKLVASFGISVEIEAICIPNDGNTLGFKSFSLPKDAPFKDICNDTDTMALLQSLYIIDKNAGMDEKAAINLSRLSEIMNGKLPPLNGVQRGFQGVYKRISQKAELLVENGMIEGAKPLGSRARLYAITNFGRLVAETCLNDNIMELMPSRMKELLDSREEGTLLKMENELKKWLI